MKRSRTKAREEARRLYLAGEAETNAEIAARLGVKPHTVGRWRKDEDWDGLRLKIDRRAGELFVEKLATDRVTLNVRHYRLWDLLLTRLMEDLKAGGAPGRPGTGPGGRHPGPGTARVSAWPRGSPRRARPRNRSGPRRKPRSGASSTPSSKR